MIESGEEFVQDDELVLHVVSHWLEPLRVVTFQYTYPLWFTTCASRCTTSNSAPLNEGLGMADPFSGYESRCASEDEGA